MSQQPALFRFFCSFLISLLFLTAPVWKDTANAATCTPKIVYVDDGDQPDFVEAGSSATFSWKVKNTSSSCNAVNYHLGFDESVPQSSTANFGGENQPAFTLMAGQTGFVTAKMVAAPSDPKEVNKKFKVYYDIFKPDGTNLIDLPLGGLYAEFTVIPKVSPPPPQDCTATLKWSEPQYDGGKLGAGVPATFVWMVTNTSTDCDAVGYHLGFNSADPVSSTANYGGTKHPSFTLKAKESGMVSAKVVLTPAEQGTYKALHQQRKNPAYSSRTEASICPV